MPYQISRGGQMYGPYTLEDLQRYLASGNVLPTDLAKSEEMTDWVPVSQILGGGPAAASAPAYPSEPVYAPTPGYGAAAGVYPDPPNLNWGLVLLFGILTCGVFFVVWELVQTLWMKRVQPLTKAMPYYIIYVVLWFLNVGSSMGRSAAMVHGNTLPASPLGILISLGTIVMAIVYRFAMRSSLEQHFNGPEPIGLRLGPVMTFFFGGLYFQYHFNKINEMKQAARYRSFGQ
jgi:GYF domain 2